MYIHINIHILRTDADTNFEHIRSGILDYLWEGSPWPSRPFKHMECSLFKHTFIQIWCFVLAPGPCGLARSPHIQMSLPQANTSQSTMNLSQNKDPCGRLSYTKQINKPYQVNLYHIMLLNHVRTIINTNKPSPSHQHSYHFLSI